MTDTTDAAFATLSAGHHLAASGNEQFVVRTVPLGGGKLSRALRGESAGSVDHAAADGEAVRAARAWLPTRPSSPGAWRARADTVRASHATPDWHAALAPAFAATGAAADRLARAAQSGVLVTTGQQPGLFGGPTYTWTKAIGALALADALEREIGMPVAPVFWAATDDSDWAEAAASYLLTRDGLRRISLAGPASDGVSMSDVPLGEVGDALDALRAASGSAAHASVLDEVASSYVPHATVGAAYLQLLRSLLEPLGIAVLDASHPSLRTAADPFLRRALAKATVVAERLTERTREMERAGFVPQVDTIDALSLVFQSRIGATGLVSDRVRERIPLTDATRLVREAEIGTLGPNVLLRPVMERCLLPTVAYCAGPGEFAYFAQVTPVAEALHAEIPLPVPRWAGELVETRDLRALDDLGLEEGALQDPHAAESLLARRAAPDGVMDAMERLRVTVDAQSRAIASAIESADSVIAPAVSDGLARDLMQRIDRFDRRVAAGVKRRETDLMRDISRLRAAFRPMGQSPERVLNLIPALARHGRVVFDSMRTAASQHARELIGTADAGATNAAQRDIADGG